MWDYQWGLKGKPDEVWKNGDKLHVVEVKATHLPEYRTNPYESHKMQLAVYMRLAQVHFKLPVESGEIRYASGQRFKYKWDYSLRNQLWRTIERIRKVDATGNTFVKVKKTQCQRCRYYSVCDKKRFAR
ncbi:CRISPR-associated protein Cas4 [Marinithermofilum abyssi]|uniref:CRISPR-associated protein Cas4 n=1 Tax=Marinithermofilum abyssi TaxID=1571185 RepID=UPI0035716A90